MKLGTKLGEMEAEKDGEKFIVSVPPESQLAQTFDKFEAKDWIALLERCKSSGMEADEITTATNKEGTQVILSAINKQSLINLMDYIAETAGISNPVAKSSTKAADKTEIDMETLKDASKRLGI